MYILCFNFKDLFLLDRHPDKIPCLANVYHFP